MKDENTLDEHSLGRHYIVFPKKAMNNKIFHGFIHDNVKNCG